jgi:sulfite reductase (NADPH) flavoprotein alpha-component
MVDLAAFRAGAVPDWRSYQAALFVVSTHGDGVPPPEARAAFEALKAAAQELKQAPGAGAVPPFSVLALGDTSYPKFCSAGKALEGYLGALGGASLTPLARTDVNREDWETVRGWMAAVSHSLGEAGFAPRLPSGVAAAPAQPEAPVVPGASKAVPRIATLVAREALTAAAQGGSADEKETIRLEFDLGLTSADEAAALSYLPGDALGIFPKNEASEVARLLSALSLDPEERVQLPAWRAAWDCAGKKTAPLCTVLAECCDLREAKPSLLSFLADSCGAAAVANGVKGKLLSADAAYLGERHVADLVLDAQQGESAPPSLGAAKLLSLLRQLQPRLYSISSSPLEYRAAVPSAEGGASRVDSVPGGRVAVTVAVVRYETLGLPRTGVCSTFLSDRAPLAEASHVFFSSNPDFRLPADPSLPLVMVGPGTGLAPFRAFIQHRAISFAENRGALGPALLFFGCRDSQKDFLYKSELERADEEGLISLFTAFSRPSDGSEKRYVQHRLLERSSSVFDLLVRQRGHFYICGDGGRMARDVEKALTQLLAAGLEAAAEGGEGVDWAARAHDYVLAMEAEGRLQRDVWIS